jgi:hypothetical protein
MMEESFRIANIIRIKSIKKQGLIRNTMYEFNPRLFYAGWEKLDTFGNGSNTELNICILIQENNKVK